MNGDFLFFLFFVIITLFMIVIRVIYGWKSPDRKKSLGELSRMTGEHEGRRSLAVGIFAGIVLLIAIILYIVFTPLTPWIRLPFPDWLRWIGVIMGFFSCFLLWWIHSTLGRGYSKSLTIQEKHPLVTEGPYQRIRHPMYTAFLFFFLAWFLISTHITFFLAWVLFLIFILMRMPREEAMLQDEFGVEYQQYMMRTGRLFPPICKKDTKE
jgi:protein-S-isoprenylcysteine O-methyltransferase Ste14